MDSRRSKVPTPEQFRKYLQEQIDEIPAFEDIDPHNDEQVRFWLEMNATPLRVDALEWLALYPEFNDGVHKVRIDLKIDVQDWNQRAKNLLGEDLYEHYTTFPVNYRLNEIVDDWDYSHLLSAKEEYLKAIKILDEWTRDYPLGLDKQIHWLRMDACGHVPGHWHGALKRYVLFDVREVIDALQRNNFPEVSVKTDSVTGDEYIELKIYAGTDLSFYNSKKFRKRLADQVHSLPKVFKPNNIRTLSLFRRLLFAQMLQKSDEATSAEAVEVVNDKIEKLHLAPIEVDELNKELSQRLKRYLIKRRSKN